MAKDVILNLRIDTKDGEKSVGSLNQEFQTTLSTMRDMEEASAAITEALKDTKIGTDQYAQLSKELINVNTELKNQELALEALDNEQVASELKSVAGGFADIAGGMALVAVGNQSMEKVVQTIAKVEGATKIVTGAMEAWASAAKLQGTLLKTTTAWTNALAAAQAKGGASGKLAAVGMKVLNAAMNASPIFMIVTAIAAVAAGFGIMAAMAGDGAKSVEELAEDMEKLNKAFDDNIKLIERQAGNQAIEAKVKLLNSLIVIETKLIKKEDELIDLQRSQPENLNAILAKTKEIEAVRADMLFARYNGELAYFDAVGAAEDKRYNEVSEKIKTVNVTTEEGIALYQKLSEERSRIFDLQMNRAARRGLLENQLLLDGEKLGIDSANRIADVRKAIDVEVTSNLKKLTDEQRKLFFELNKDKVLVIEDVYKREVDAAKTAFDRIKELHGKNSWQRLEAEKAYNESVKLAALKRERDLNELVMSDLKVNIIKTETLINNYKKTLLTATGIQSFVAMIQLHAKEKKLLELQMQDALTITTLTEEEKLKIKSEYLLKIAELEKEFRDKTHQEATVAAEENMTETIARWAGENAVYIEFVQNTIAQSMELLSQLFTMQAEAAAVKREGLYDAESQALKNQLANRLISQKEYDAKVKMLEDKKAQEEKMARLKAFKQAKALAIVNAIMGTAQAVLSAFASAAAIPIAGVALGPIMAGVAGALGAAQIAIIASQKFKGNRGGKVPGAPSKVDSVDAELAPGEVVINSESAMMFPQLLSELNKAGGGIGLAPEPIRDLTGGGNDSETIFERSNNGGAMRAYVVESDISTSQKRVNRMEQSAEF
jgi:hypothetical protein